jgi:hypothetical protein
MAESLGNCPNCGARMVQLFSSVACADACEKRVAAARTPDPVTKVARQSVGGPAYSNISVRTDPGSAVGASSNVVAFKAKPASPTITISTPSQEQRDRLQASFHALAQALAGAPLQQLTDEYVARVAQTQRHIESVKFVATRAISVGQQCEVNVITGEVRPIGKPVATVVEPVRVGWDPAYDTRSEDPFEWASLYQQNPVSRVPDQKETWHHFGHFVNYTAEEVQTAVPGLAGHVRNNKNGVHGQKPLIRGPEEEHRVMINMTDRDGKPVTGCTFKPKHVAICIDNEWIEVWPYHALNVVEVGGGLYSYRLVTEEIRRARKSTKTPGIITIVLWAETGGVWIRGEGRADVNRPPLTPEEILKGC